MSEGVTEGQRALHAEARRQIRQGKPLTDAQRSAYSAVNKADKLALSLRDPKGFRIKRLMAQAKHRAKRKGLEFTITEDDIDWIDRCPYTGAVIKYKTYEIGRKQTRENQPDDFAASLDRIDSTKGYVPGNVEVVPYAVNVILSKHESHMIKLALQYSKGHEKR